MVAQGGSSNEIKNNPHLTLPCQAPKQTGFAANNARFPSEALQSDTLQGPLLATTSLRMIRKNILYTLDRSDPTR